MRRLVVAFAAAAFAFAGVPLTACAGVGVIAADLDDDPPVGAPERDASVEDACEPSEGGPEPGVCSADAIGAVVDRPANVSDARFFRAGCIRPTVVRVHGRDLAIRGPPVAA